MRVPHCYHCQSKDNLYSVRYRDGVPVLHICKDCNTEYKKQYRQRPNGKEAVKRAVKKYESNNENRVNAWKEARVLKSKPCEVCGVKNTHKHHPDISKPLDVIFLCPLHHKQAHKSMEVI